jgi:hypothetical protein
MIRSRTTWKLSLGVLFLVSGLAGPALGQDDPAKAAAEAARAAQKKPGPAWGGASGTTRVPIESGSEVIFGNPGCPVVVVGSRVFNLGGGAVQTLEGTYDRGKLREISDGGTYFAAPLKESREAGMPIGVWSTETGKKVFEVPGTPGQRVTFLHFSREKYLLTAHDKASQIDVWNIESGELQKSLAIPGDNNRRIEPGKIAFTPDGKYFALAANDRLAVCATANGKEVAWMSAPGAPQAGPAIKGRGKLPVVAPLVPGERRFAFHDIQHLAFSPDGQELAAQVGVFDSRLVVWDGHGKVVGDYELSKTLWNRGELRWLPDGTGWFVGGRLLDRTSGRVVLKIRDQFGHEPVVFPLDRERILGQFKREQQVMEPVAIPWKEINASLKALESGAPAILSPAQPISAAAEIAGARGDQGAAAKMLYEAICKRLERDKIKVEQNQSTFLRVHLTEKAGERLKIVESESRGFGPPMHFGPFGGPQGKDTGRTAVEAHGTIVVELFAQGNQQPLWKETLNSKNGTSFQNTNITDETLRKSMLDNACGQIQGLEIPYFIPAAQDQLPLPAIID